MEMQRPSNPIPNSYGNANNKNFGDNVDPTSSSQHASDNPSPTSTPHIPFLLWNSDSPSPSAAAGAPSECMGLYKQRALADGDFRFRAANDDVGLSGKPISAAGHEGMGAEEDLVSAFLDLQNLGENDIGGGGRGGGGLMDHDGDGGGKLQKSSSSSSSSSFRVPEPKKAIPAEKLDEIRAVDPKRVKRILANRQSAARSKERKARYLLELERRFQSLQSEATNLLAQLRIYQRDATSLSKENADLKIQLQALKQQAELHDTLNEALKQEVERLKIATGEIKAPSESFSLQGACLLPYSPLASPSNLQPTQYSPLASPSTMQTVCYSPAAAAASLSPRTTPNLFPIPKQPVPVLAQLPPLHNSRSSLCFRPPNPQTPPQQNLNHPGGGLQGFDNGKRGSNLEGSPVSGGESSSATQLRTP